MGLDRESRDYPTGKSAAKSLNLAFPLANVRLVKMTVSYLDISPLETAAVISEKSSAEFLPLISKHKSSTEIVAETPIRGLKRPKRSIVRPLET